MNPRFSVVTPSFNSSEYIEQCIVSIHGQSYKNFEHFIIDGGSTDGTLEIIQRCAEKFKFTWISEPDNGMYDAINKGFALAKGEIFCWLNSDDMYFPWTFETVSKLFDQNQIQWLTGIPAHWSSKSVLYFKDYCIPAYSRSCIKSGMHHGRGLGFIQQESTFWTRKLWEKAGSGLRTDLGMASDFYLWRKFAEYEPLYTTDVVLGGFRRHSGQKSDNIDGYYDEITEYCSIFSFFLWSLQKLFGFNKFYYFLNRKQKLSAREIIGYPNVGFKYSAAQILKWFIKVVLLKAKPLGNPIKKSN